MPLQTQLLDVLFQGGLREDIDPRVLPAGSVLEAENVVYDHAGGISKRIGYGSYAIDITPSGTMVAPEAILARGDEKLVIANVDSTYDQIYSYSPAAVAWKAQDSTSFGLATTGPMASESSSNGVEDAHIVEMSGKTMHVWVMREDNSVSVTDSWIMYRVVDSSTGAVLVQDKAMVLLNDLLLRKVEVFSDGTTVVIVHGSAADGIIYCRRYTESTDTWTSNNIKSSLSTAAILFDACPGPSNGTFFTAYYTTSARTTLQITKYTTSSLATSTFTVLAAAGERVAITANASTVAVAWLTDASGDPTWDLNVLELVQSTMLASWSIVTYSGVPEPYDDIGPLTIGHDNSGNLWVVYTDARSSYVYKVTSIGAKAFSTYDYRTLAHSYAASRPFVYGTKLYQAFATCPGLDNDTAVSNLINSPASIGLYRLDFTTSNSGDYFFGGELVCSLVQNDSYGVLFLRGVARVNQIYQDATRFRIPAIRLTSDGITRFRADEIQIQFPRRLSSTAQSWAHQGIEVNGSLIQTGGLTTSFDGEQVVECGFTYGPKIEGITEIAGSFTAGDVIGIASYYEWFDTKGCVHRSPVSVASYTMLANSKTPSVVFRTIHATRRVFAKNTTEINGSNVRIVVYRTAANSSGPYYYVGSTDGTYTLINQPHDSETSAISVGTVSTSQGLLPFDIPGNPGVLMPEMPPGSRAICQWKNRVWIASADDTKELWFSRLIVKGEAPAFSPYLKLRLDDSPDGITGIAPLADKLVVFTKSRIYYIVGDGPNDNGSGAPFVGPILITADIGCSDPRSVVTYTEGALFDCGDGIRLLNTGLQISDIGGPVQDTCSTYTIPVGAVADLKQQRIYCLRYTTAGGLGRLLVYDYRAGAWTVFKHQAPGYASSLGKWGDAHVVGGNLDTAASPDVLIEASGDSQSAVYRDAASAIPATVSTPWIHVAGIAGFQRVRRAIISGYSTTDVDFTLSVYYNNATSASETATFAASNGPFRFSYHLAKQKCSSVRFKLAESTLDQTFILNGLTLELGVKQGPPKLAVAYKG